MPEVTKAQAELETMKKQSEDDMKLIQEEFVKKYTAFQQEQATLPKNVLDRRQKELEDMRVKAMQTEQDYAQQYNQKQAELMQPILKKLTDAIMAVGQEGGYIYIMDEDMNFNPAVLGTPILYVNETLSTNVTDAVKAKLGIK
jgi:outer membrane protein